MLPEHVYRRSKLRSNSFDAYNSLASQYPDGNNEDNFWSNGYVTHLTVTSAPSSYLSFSDDMVAAHPKPSEFPKSNTSSTTNSNPTTNTSNVAARSILSGSIAGITSTILFHPTDVLRTKIQAAASLEVAAASSTSAASAPSAVRATPLQQFSHTVRNGGFRALYTGLSPVLGAQALYKATVFMVNNITHRMLTEHRTNERAKLGIFAPYRATLFDTWICGALGGCINASLFVAPVEFVRNQQIAQHTSASTAKGASDEAMKKKMKLPSEIVRATLKADGISGLWRGAGVTILRDSLGCGSFFVMFELSKRHLGEHFGEGTAMTRLLSGACAGLGFWAFALPLDTLKTLVQTGQVESARDVVLSSLERDGIWKTATLLTRGWQLAFGRGAPAAAITLSTYATTFEMTGEWLR